jgi:hypothetical protein
MEEPDKEKITLKKLNELPILERLQLRDLMISNLLSEDEDLQPLTSEQEAKIDQELAVEREMFWQIIEWSSDEKALTLFSWLTKQSLAELRLKIAEVRAKEDEV